MARKAGERDYRDLKKDGEKPPDTERERRAPDKHLCRVGTALHGAVSVAGL